MASEPKKDTTTEAAMQAVEDALSLDDLQISLDDDSEAPIEPSKQEVDFDPDFAELESKLAEAANGLRQERNSTTVNAADIGFPELADAVGNMDRAASAGMRAKADGIAPETARTERYSRSKVKSRREEVFDEATPIPANRNKRDDIADIVHAMERQNPATTHWIAAVLSIAWLGLCAGLYFVGTSEGTLQISSLGTWGYAGLTAVAVVPVLLFWAFSVMVRRAQEMRVAARAMTEAAIRLLQPEEVATDSIVTIGRAVRREVASIGDGIERALGRASELESLVQSEVRNLERSYSDSEIRLRGLVQELSGERIGIINHAEKLRESLSFTHTGLTEELDQVAGRIQYSIDEGTIRMSEALRARHETIHATLEEAGTTLVSLLSSSGVDLQNAVALATNQAREGLSGKAQELGKQVNMIGQAVASLLDTRTAAIKEAGENVTREIEMTLGARAMEFSSRLDQLDSNFGAHSATLLEKVGGQADRLSGQLERVDQMISTRGETLVETLGMRTSALDKVLGERTIAIGEAIGQRLAGFGQSLTGRVDQVVETLGARHQSMETLAEKINEALDSRATKIEETLRGRTADLARVFNDGDQTVRSTIELGLTGSAETTRQITGLIEERNLKLIDELDKRAHVIGDTLRERTAELARTFSDGDAAVRSTIEFGLTGSSQSADRIAGLIEERNSALVGLIDERTSQLAASLDERVSGLIDGIDSRTAFIGSELDRQIAEIHGGIEHRAAGLIGGLDKRTSIIGSELDRRMADIHSGIEQRAVSLLGGITERTAAIASELESRTAEMHSGIDQRTGGLIGGLDQRTALIANELDRQTAEIHGGFDQRATNLIHGLDDRASLIGSEMDRRISGIHSGIDQRAANLLGGMEARTTGLAGVLDERTGRIIQGVDEKAGAFIESLDKRAQMLVMAVEDKNRALSTVLSGQTQSISEAIDQKAERMSQILSERATAINASLGTGLLETQRNIEERTGELNRVLSERMREFNEVLENHAKPVVEAITARGNDVTVRLGTLHQTVASDLNQLLTALSSTSDLMQKMLDTVGSRLSSMQETITTQARDLTQAVDKANRDVNISAQVSTSAQQKMDTLATGLVATISGIAERFEEQGLMLQHATRLIDSAQGNFSSTLEEKQEMLHSLATGLVDRTQTIERTMNAFGEMMRKTLDETSEKSRGVGSIVATEIGSAIDQANMRFAKSVEVMRQAAADVQRDLEETREQMRRGVLELPDETRESAEAMRQVVSDQIAALRDLSSIVARSGKAIELPPSQRVAAIGGGGSTFGRTNTRMAEPAAPSLPPLSPAPLRQEVTDSGRPFGLPGSLSGATAEPAPRTAAPVQARREEPSARPASPLPQTGREAETAGQGGWVSDLLRRASREEDETPLRREQSKASQPRQAAPVQEPTLANRSPLHVVESLNSLSMDIARAIDHNAFIELWDRYQRGERNVFTRRLYTLQGEQTFDEIRSKYAREPEFRAAVNRYVTDFEKLLADVSRNDRDQMMTQTYLTSDTGKVYTMLAHAAGRFGG